VEMNHRPYYVIRLVFISFNKMKRRCNIPDVVRIVEQCLQLQTIQATDSFSIFYLQVLAHCNIQRRFFQSGTQKGSF